MSLPPDAVPETPEETIERLLKSNNRLAQMVKASSDRMQSATRSLLATGWDAGVAVALNHAILNEDGVTLRLEHLDGTPWPNPYRQPIELPGDTK